MPPISYSIPEIEWMPIVPMLIVAVTGIIALILEMARPKKDNSAIVAVSLGGLIISGVALFVQLGEPAIETAAGMVLRDNFGTVMQLLLLVSAAISILFSEGYLREKKIPFGEFYTLLIWSTFGGMIMCASNNLLMIFLGLEVLSISLYVMAGLSRSEARSGESALKYFLLGSFASGFLLYGIAFFYGATGGLNLEAVRPTWLLDQPGTHGLLIFGLALMLIGLGFKASFVPFHQWTPDVYQGAPTNVSAFMAAGSKVAAFAALWRVLDASILMRDYWIPALSVIAVLTMTVGNLAALGQKDVKRILGYSSIANAGYILVGVLAYFARPDLLDSGSVLFFLTSYLLMTAGAFAVVSLAAKDGKEATDLTDLHGMYQRNPLAAIALVIFMASLIGIPPFAGFFGKFLIFKDAVQVGLAPLAIVLAVNSVISLFYYLGIARAAFVAEREPGSPELAKGNYGLAASCAICAVGVLAASFFAEPLIQIISKR